MLLYSKILAVLHYVSSKTPLLSSPLVDPLVAAVLWSILYLISGGDWQIWECLDTPSTTVTLQKLVKGQEYQFRVIAINKAGRSEPSVASRPKMAKETDCKYMKKV